MVRRKKRRSHILLRLKILRTLRSRIFETAQSGVGSNGPPHVVAAFATRISIRSSAPSNSASLSISESCDRSAAYPTAVPKLPGSEFSFWTAWSKPDGPSAFRATRMTFFAPASRNAVAAWRPRPREPSRYSVSGLTGTRRMLRTPSNDGNLAVEAEEARKGW